MKKKIFTFCLILVLLAVSFATGFSVTKSQAVAPLAFGGMLVESTPCTCSDALWEFYAPLGGPSSFPGGALSYTLHDTLTYAFYNVVTPGVWHLGLYIPGVQDCWEGVFPFCVPLPTLGTELMVGTSLTPSPAS